jgi:SAM-dependent methyltransferase
MGELGVLDGVEGWLTPAQAQHLHEAAAAVPSTGRIVEIGSFRGRSTIALALGAAEGVEVVAIDPHAGNDRGPREIEGFESEAADDNEAFRANLARAGVADRVRHVRAFSADAHSEVEGQIDLLWIDGAHRFGPARADIRDWGDRVVDGGRLLVHDSWSSVGVTLGLLATVTFARRWRYDGRTGSLAAYTRTTGGAGSAARQLAELPWFALNLVRKLLIVLRLKRGPWPY